MWQPKKIVIDKLVDLIQQLQSRRETGRLTIRHGSGITTEEGAIIFTNGKITEVRIDRRTGSEALNKLSTWENCLCEFAPSSLDHSVDLHTSIAHERHAEMLPNTRKDRPSDTPSPFPQIRATPLERDSRASGEDHLRIPEVLHSVNSLQQALNRIEQLGLSRAHRRLFLLIDGRRSITDLIRLMGWEKDAVYQLLRDLQQALLIDISK